MIVTVGPASCPFAPWRPAAGRVFDAYAIDCGTTAVDADHPEQVPALVLAAACDGRRGAFVPRGLARAFLEAHAGVPATFHNAAFDLAVLGQVVAPDLDVYAAVEAGAVCDTMVLHRLLTLATEGHPARGRAGLDDCMGLYLGVTLPKHPAVRATFGRYLGRPPSEIPPRHLESLAKDALATWLLGRALGPRVEAVLAGAAGVWGYKDAAWLRECVRRFGP